MSNSSLEQDKVIYADDFVNGEGNARELMEKSLSAKEIEMIREKTKREVEAMEERFVAWVVKKAAERVIH